MRAGCRVEEVPLEGSGWEVVQTSELSRGESEGLPKTDRVQWDPGPVMQEGVTLGGVGARKRVGPRG